jgi:hypothetical protein
MRPVHYLYMERRLPIYRSFEADLAVYVGCAGVHECYLPRNTSVAWQVPG